MTYLPKRTALQFVVLLGIVSLFADMTYEGAKSITGQYLSLLGASGTVVGVVAGLGELIGYSIRLVSGYVSDRTGKYWAITISGYALNLLAIPLLALAGNWPLAATLMILERLGKAIRSPAKDAMLSYATKEMGRGWGFGLHEAMDQIGAVAGPLIVSVVLYYQGSYPFSFALLLIPALCALIVLFVARWLYPRPHDLEKKTPKLDPKGFSKTYWFYITAFCCVAAGYMDFPLIAYHFTKSAVVSPAWIPIFFAIAMAADGVAALVFGYWYDRKGLVVLIAATGLGAFFVPLVFMNSFYLVLAGMVVWGVGLGAQESIMRAVVGNLVTVDRRGTAYGLFNIWFGGSWFLGSALIGFLYDVSLISAVIFSFGIQLVAIPFLWSSGRLQNSR